MEVVFGWHLDGFAYPENSTGVNASLGSLVVGPAGLLGLLETRLGLRRPLVAKTLRVAEYLANLQQADDRKQFYSASLAADAWGTAQHLLSVRDELIAAGWQKQSIHESHKLIALAKVERVSPITGGFGERMHDVMSQLKPLTTPVLRRLSIVGAITTLPPAWQETIKLLQQSGTQVEQLAPSPSASPTDLGKLQQRVLGTSDSLEKISLSGDGTISIVDAEDELQAATFTAAWLAQRQALADIVLIRGDDCSQLSQACQRQGLPVAGRSPRSKFRAITQVLPLAFELACRPIDPKKLVEFICIQGGPIPGWMQKHLSNALGRAPGIGGPLWQEAWDKCVETQSSWIAKDDPQLSKSELLKKATARVKPYQSWFEEKVAAPDDAISVSSAQDICVRVENWATGKAAQAELREPYDIGAAQARLLRQMIGRVNQSSIALSQLRKMIEEVCAYGSTMTSAEAAPWSLVDRPGQIWGPAGTVVWWGFSQPQWTSVRTSLWSDDEIKVLHDHGIFVERPLEKLARESSGWWSAVMNATDRLVLVMPRMVAGVRSVAHPLWDELRSLFDQASLDAISVRASQLFRSAELSFAQTQIQCEEQQRAKLPGALRTWTVSPNVIAPRAKESFSSIDKLLGCPLAWTLQYAGRMWAPKTLELPQKQLLLGNLAHAVVNHLYETKKDWQPEEAQEAARELVMKLIPEMASALLLPGASPQLREAMDALPKSVCQLAKFLNQAHVTVEGCEVPLQARLNATTDIGGAVDMLIRLPSGRRAVLDFKWSAFPMNYRLRISEGRAIQLAVYNWLANVTDDQAPPDLSESQQNESSAAAAGFFMFRQGELYFTTDGIFPRYTLVRKMERDLDETWRLTVEAYDRAMAELTSGTVTATGITDDTIELDDFINPVLVDPPCHFCDLGHFCGKKVLQ